MMLKKAVLLLLGLTVLATGALAQPIYTPLYWIVGSAQDSADKVSTAEGRSVWFYGTDFTGEGMRAEGTVVGGRFMLNAFDAYNLGLTVGQSYLVAIPQDTNGYGATAEVTISGVGYDEAALLLLKYGEGPPGSGETGTIVGQVTSSNDGSAIANAAVSVGTPSGVISAVTDDGGNYTLNNVPAGSQTVHASATHYISGSKMVTVIEGGTVTANITLDTLPAGKANLHGYVLTKTSTPISGATVAAGATSASTGSDGWYQMTINAGSYAVQASKTGYASQTKDVTLSDGDSKELDFSLDVIINGGLTGTVTGVSGLALDGALVTVEGIGLSAATNATGVYTISNIPVGVYNVSAGKLYYITQTTTEVAIIANTMTTRNFVLSRIKEKPPLVKQIKFDNRVYQKELVAKGKQFVVKPTPTISVQLESQDDYGISIEGFRIIRDKGTTNMVTYTVPADAFEPKPADIIKAYAVVFKVPEAMAIPEDEHFLEFQTASLGLKGDAAATAEVATVTVMGGPLRLIGVPLTFPSPYSISKNKTVTIQYELSQDANIDIFIIGVDGTRLKRFTFDAGSEGGSAGINKVTWDGMTDFNYLAGNGIYIGTIIGRDEGRLLGKVKLTIVD